MQLPGSNISIPTHGRAHTGAQHKDNEFINIIRIRLNISKLNCPECILYIRIAPLAPPPSLNTKIMHIMVTAI